jgi:beta-glucosidase
VLLPWLGGQEVSYALDDMLFGRLEPSGRLPVTLPLRLEHTPAYGSFPGENDTLTYSEGLLVGYRWYDTRHLPVAFPFGHGGSYTTFSWGAAKVDGLTVTVPVTNTGDRAGSEVVQVYVRPHEPRLTRPRSELKGFAKATLEPGETRLVTVTLHERAFSHWDDASSERAFLRDRLGEGSIVPADQGPAPRTAAGWYVDPGTYDVVVARSVEDVVEVVPVTIAP